MEGLVFRFIHERPGTKGLRAQPLSQQAATPTGNPWQGSRTDASTWIWGHFLANNLTTMDHLNRSWHV
eukprot:1710897-Amphidinium_carterae.1